MKLQEHSEFVREFFEKPRPSKSTVRRWIEDGEIPGKVIGERVYVDVNRFIAGPVHKPSMPDLMS